MFTAEIQNAALLYEEFEVNTCFVTHLIESRLGLIFV